MVPNARIRGVRQRAGRYGVALAIVLAAVFGLGVVVGYHSIYRNIEVAMLAPPKI